MNERIQTYLEAMKSHNQATEILQNIIQIVVEVANVLQSNPRGFSFSNTPTGMPLTASRSSNSVAMDATKWPTANQIQEALANWHTTHQAVQTAWTNIPAQDRAGLQAPGR